MSTTTGPNGVIYVPIIDISRHQGNVDFGVMLEQGIEGVIIRTNHATTVDDRCAEYVDKARRAGYADSQLGAYTFCNPKRASGAASGKAMVDTVRRIFGHTDTIMMLDIEAYAGEPGTGEVIKGAEFAQWIRDHIAAIRSGAPDATLIAYSNASFWNPWVGDQQLARELEWIVPRYPIYSAGGYIGNPVPSASGWAAWAWRVGPKGPIAPSGAKWLGWQFSAGWNRQGPRYGCQSSDLDLNIVELEAWRRWTGTNSVPEPWPPPIPVPSPIAGDEDEEGAMKIKTPGQWFEKVGLDLRTIGNGVEFAGLPGNEVDLSIAEMAETVAACRYTYGPVKAAMGPEFVALWNSKREPVAGGGSGGEQLVRVQVDVTGP